MMHAINISDVTRACPDFRRGVLVLGVGHAGTSTVACALRRVGYTLAGDETLCEHRAAVQANERYVRALNLSTTRFDEGAIPRFAARAPGRTEHSLRVEAKNVVRQLRWPFVVKDPRFVWTLHHWAPLFAASPPGLIHVTRQPEKVMRSHLVRRERLSMRDVQTRIFWDQWQHSHWPFCSVSFPIRALGRHVPIKNHHRNP
jgi:hypothetical protein